MKTKIYTAAMAFGACVGVLWSALHSNSVFGQSQSVQPVAHFWVMSSRTFLMTRMIRLKV